MKRRIAVIITALAMGATVAIPAGAVLAKPASLSLATTLLPNGLSAAIVASPGQHLTGNIDASNADVGIYVGPGIKGVVIDGAIVTGAHDHGIFVQDTSGIIIENSTVSGGAAPGSGTHAQYLGGPLGEDKAIVLAGTKDCLVEHNTIQDNFAGGIGVYDDGPSANVTFALTTINSTPVSSAGNVVTGNWIQDNGSDCSIVVSSKNGGSGVSGTVVSYNTVIAYDNITASDHYNPVPSVGGIIIAGGEFGSVKVMGTLVENNTVDGGLLPGISIHGSSTAKIRGTQLIGNVLNENAQPIPFEITEGPTTYPIGSIITASGYSEGIEIAGNPGVTIGTLVDSDTVNGDAIGVFHVGDGGTDIVNLMGDATTPVAP